MSEFLSVYVSASFVLDGDENDSYWISLSFELYLSPIQLSIDIYWLMEKGSKERVMSRHE